MTKADLISKVVEKTGVKKSVAETAINAVFDALAESLVKGERTAIPGFGVFSVKERKPRKGRNPKTGEEILIPERKVVVFTASKTLVNAIKK